jgi:hypothetical protein
MCVDARCPNASTYRLPVSYLSTPTKQDLHPHNTRTHTHIYMQTHTHTHTYTCKHTQAQANMTTGTHTHTHIYAHNTHTYTNKHNKPPTSFKVTLSLRCLWMKWLNRARCFVASDQRCAKQATVSAYGPEQSIASVHDCGCVAKYGCGCV